MNVSGRRIVALEDGAVVVKVYDGKGREREVWFGCDVMAETCAICKDKTKRC